MSYHYRLFIYWTKIYTGASTSTAADTAVGETRPPKRSRKEDNASNDDA